MNAHQIGRGFVKFCVVASSAFALYACGGTPETGRDPSPTPSDPGGTHPGGKPTGTPTGKPTGTPTGKPTGTPTTPPADTNKKFGEQCEKSAQCASKFCVFIKGGASLGMCTKTCGDDIDCPGLDNKCVRLSDAPQKVCIPK